MTLALFHKFNVDEKLLEPGQRLTDKLMVAGSVFAICFGILRISFFCS
jgi:hypothetical protein